ncbi:YARHG domain-containing protein [Maribacter vaceletii]|uniref:YARHG domain-containing protein n=1 Tax=Maribacter vaceletii TaxID=1206816 RepID=A0A495ECE3_9FLAO|nr:YARHG domain-containing protein [Maribacter vaceletii]RKR14233.1 YARHG domain-containing protein [Maribacter vaceletii]
MRILLLFLSVTNFVFAQYMGGQEVNESDFSKWVPKFETEYAGVYHFGESESESDFYLFFSEGSITGQVRSGYWEEKTGDRKSKYITLTNIKIDKVGHFTSDQHSGQFVTYKTKKGEYYKALKIDNPWASWIDASDFEIGTKIELAFDDIFYGKYGETSYRKLTKDELKKINTQELIIMRNEIYARYGYIFIKNGKMDKYFKKQNWYRAEHKEVSVFLTEIECYNIKLIKELE